MGILLNIPRTCGVLCLILAVNCAERVSNGRIVSFSIDGKSCAENCKYLLNVNGGEFLGHTPWRLTSLKGGECDIYSNYEINELRTEKWHTKVEVIVPNVEGRLYFCLQNFEGRVNPFGGIWIHQEEALYLDPKNDVVSDIREGKMHINESNETQSHTTESDEKNSQQNLQANTEKWLDLSRDIDVNYLPDHARPTRDEQKDIEIVLNGLYVPLNADEEVQSGNSNRNYRDGRIRKKRSRSQGFESRASNWTGPTRSYTAFTSPKPQETAPAKLRIQGLRVEESDKEPKVVEGGIPSVLADTRMTLRLFGEGLTERTVIAFTHDILDYDRPCKFMVKGEYMAKEGSVTADSALFDVIAPPSHEEHKLYICAKNLKPGVTDPRQDQEKFFHQGTEPWKVLETHNKLLPLWVSLVLILICLMFSALFSGLNLGLMSLDKTELKIISNTGTEKERKYARAIMPVRDHGNYLLCSILLGNVAVNSTFTILLDELTSGLFAVIFSTLAIVLLGEITPQAICSRHGLMVGAKSIMVTKAVMALTAPLAYPVSKLLDYFLGEEIGSVFNRERLKELVKVTTGVNDLDKDEVNIISGALELRKKTVCDVMTKLEDVFMLPITSVLDFETMSEIIKSGYSRIPVYEGDRKNIVTVLFIKDLAFVDPDDNTPLKTLCQYYQNPCNFVFEDVTLDVMFRQFKEGHKGHMAFVHRINNEGEGDPFYETIGLVTLEDVIEELIQAEIVDETDVFLDNRTKRRRNRPQNKLQDFAAFAERHENQRIHISPQLTLATFQFLSTSVEAFRPDVVSETVLRRLLKQDVIHHIKLKGKDRKDPSIYVFQQGKPVDYFVLILEGRVEVTVGRENLVFEAGPFTYFGVQALTQNIGVAESPTPSAMGSLQNINMDAMLRHTFVPDYSVRAVTQLYYLTVKRSLYLAAKRATLMEKGALSKGGTAEQFDTEVDKIRPSQVPFCIPPDLILARPLQLLPKHNTIELKQRCQHQKPATAKLTNAYDDVAVAKTNGGKRTSFDRIAGNVYEDRIEDRFERDSVRDEEKIKTLMEPYYRKDLRDAPLPSPYDQPSTSHIPNGIFEDPSQCSVVESKSVQFKEPPQTTELDSTIGGEFDRSFDSDTDEEDNRCIYKNRLSERDRLSVCNGNRIPFDFGNASLERMFEMQLLQSVDEDMSISGDHKSPSRQVCTVSPNLPALPTSASPHTRASFAASAPAVLSPERRGNGGVHLDGSKEEQERLLRSE